MRMDAERSSVHRRLTRLVRLKKAFVVSLLGYAPAMVGVGAVLARSPWSDGRHEVVQRVAVVWMAASLVLWVWVATRRCPVCGRLFSWRGIARVRLFRMRCAHCGASPRGSPT
jgi:hypothetical protein